jgi:hypothetical protein
MISRCRAAAVPKKGSRAAAAPRWFVKKGTAPLPRWYSKKCFDFRACDWFELELLLLIDLIC